MKEEKFGKRIFRLDERGFALLSVVIAVPLLVMLLAGLTRLLAVGVKSYEQLTARQELTDEITFAFSRVCYDLAYAEAVNPGDFYLSVKVRQPDAAAAQWVDYTLASVDGVDYLRRNDQPLTGENLKSRVTVNNFSYRLKGTNVVEVELTGSLVGKETTYSLKTAVLCLNIP